MTSPSTTPTASSSTRPTVTATTKSLRATASPLWRNVSRMRTMTCARPPARPALWGSRTPSATAETSMSTTSARRPTTPTRPTRTRTIWPTQKSRRRSVPSRSTRIAPAVPTGGSLRRAIVRFFLFSRLSRMEADPARFQILPRRAVQCRQVRYPSPGVGR